MEAPPVSVACKIIPRAVLSSPAKLVTIPPLHMPAYVTINTALSTAHALRAANKLPQALQAPETSLQRQVAKEMFATVVPNQFHAVPGAGVRNASRIRLVAVQPTFGLMVVL